MPATSFASMPIPILATESPRTSPPFHRRRKSWARKIERCCCTTFAYFPLAFVYGLTSWAVWVEVTVALLGFHDGLAYVRAGLGIALYALANLSYTTAVFTPPGSPLDPKRDYSNAGFGRRKGGGYEGLPTCEEDDATTEAIPHEWRMSTVTAKSSGKPRYCKKCLSVKPDRTHHCSTCGQCVLKMDHHCPWLATRVGLRNYKAFILFLIYVSLFCWLCFAVSAWWVWAEITDSVQMEEGFQVVNTILLSVLSGIIGLVLSGFTTWHLYLVATGQTTIESLEKTRYLSPLRKSMEHQFQESRHYLSRDGTPSADSALKEIQPIGERLKEIHANALPGVLRPEEGEASNTPSRGHTPIPAEGPSDSPAHHSLRHSYASLEAQRERERYRSYLDEVDSEKLPNAFDMGWKRNVIHVFGHHPLYWFLPICNTSGDGWQWEVSPNWTEARDRIAREREQKTREEAFWNQPPSQPTLSFEPPPRRQDLRWMPGQGFIDRTSNVPSSGNVSPGKAASGGGEMQLQPLDRRKSAEDREYDTESGEDKRVRKQNRSRTQQPTENWNDLPEGFLDSRSGLGNKSQSRGTWKGD